MSEPEDNIPEEVLGREDPTLGVELFPLNSTFDQVWQIIATAPEELGRRLFYKLRGKYGSGVTL